MSRLCCGLSLRLGVKLIAILEIIGCGLILTLLSLIMIDVSFEGPIGTAMENHFGLERRYQFVLSYMCWILIFISLLLNVTLCRGANKFKEFPQSYEACRIWLVVNNGVFIMHYVWSVMSINLFWNILNAEAITANILFVTYRAYTMIIVYQLFEQVKKQRARAPEIATIILPSTPSNPHRPVDCPESEVLSLPPTFKEIIQSSSNSSSPQSQSSLLKTDRCYASIKYPSLVGFSSFSGSH